jgi:hypothetical protein
MRSRTDGLAVMSLAIALAFAAPACSLTYAFESRLIGTGPVRFHCGVLRVDANDQADAVQICRNHIGDETRNMGPHDNPRAYWDAVNDCTCTPAQTAAPATEAPSSGGAIAETWTDEQIAAALAPARPVLSVCAGALSSFDLHMLFTVSGHVEGASCPALSDAQLSCVRDALTHVQLRGRVQRSRDVTLRFEHAP